MDWFLYANGLRHGRVKQVTISWDYGYLKRFI